MGHNSWKKTTDKNLKGTSIENILGLTYRLTPAEIKIVVMLIEYPDLKSTASALNLALSTVRTHLKHIYRKTNTNSKLMLLREIATGPASKLINKQLNGKSSSKNWTDITGS